MFLIKKTLSSWNHLNPNQALIKTFHRFISETCSVIRSFLQRSLIGHVQIKRCRFKRLIWPLNETLNDLKVEKNRPAHTKSKISLIKMWFWPDGGNKNNHRKFEGSSRKYKQQPEKAQTSEKTKRWNRSFSSPTPSPLSLLTTRFILKGWTRSCGGLQGGGGGRWCGEGEVGSAAKLKWNQPRAQHADTPTHYRAAGTSRQLNYRSPRGPRTRWSWVKIFNNY